LSGGARGGRSGADALSLVNTFVALAINAQTRRPRLATASEALRSGHQAIALPMVYEAAQAARSR